ATVGFFPVDAQTLEYLRFTGRDEQHVRVVEEYCKAQGLFRTDDTPDPIFSDTIELDLGSVEPSIAGPKRPQDRIPLRSSKKMFMDALNAELERVGTLAGKAEVARATAVSADPGLSPSVVAASPAETVEPGSGVQVTMKGETFTLNHGSVVIAAITSCTNTSNPSVMLGAGLLARNAVARGLRTKPWVKTSLAPGSKVVTDYYAKAGVMEPLEKLGFY